MDVRDIPSSRSQIDRVAKTSDEGRPLAMPKKKIVLKRLSRSRAVHGTLWESAMAGF
jgi:hypothetical protein